MLDGVTFCYPIPADPLMFHDPDTEKSRCHTERQRLYVPAGLEFMDTIHARSRVYEFLSVF